MSLKNKSVLVTGGTGFVGSHLVKALVKEGARVVTTFLDYDPNSYFVSQKLDKKVAMVNADVSDFEKMMDVVTKYEVEYVFHLAAQALVDVAYYNPKRTLYDNILGTINVLECARLYPNIKGVIFASSDKAYGKTGEKKYKEDFPLKGDHPYEVSKSAADLIANSYYKTYDVPVTISRFGNIYGEGDPNLSRIIPGAIEAAVNDTVLEIRSDGKFVRDYLYVKDVVNGYLLLAENIDKAKGEAYNFGSYETLSVIELLKRIEEGLGQKIKYKILNQAKNEIPYQSLSFRKIEKELGWKPKYTIMGTIEKIHFWYEEYLENR